MRMLRLLLFAGWTPSRLLPDVGITLLRIFTGLAMALAHGWDKMNQPTEALVARAEGVGFPFPTVFGYAAALSEFVGGLLLATGLLTRLSAFFIACTMAVAAFIHHAEDPFGDKERALLFLFICVQFIFLGGGRFSVDHFLRRV
ncbi:MAG: DoxX family protein [Phycisphaeraceae bacterium]